MPQHSFSDENLRTQRENIRRGLLRTNTAAVAILLVVVGLAAAAVLQADRAMQARARAVQAERDAREKLWKSYGDQARARRASPQAGRRLESIGALASAAALRPSVDLRNDAIASLAFADFRLKTKLGPTNATQLAMDSKFERYAVADSNGVIQVRSRATDGVLVELPTLITNKVQFIFSFSPDGRFLPVVYNNGETCVWDLSRKEVVLTFRLLRLFQTVSFSPDNARLAIAEAGGTVAIHDLSGGTEPQIIQSNLGIHGVLFSPDGRRLGIYSERSNEVIICEAATGKVTLRLFHPNAVRALAWHPDGQLIATACGDHDGYLWDLSQPDKPIRTFGGHQSSLSDVLFHPGGQLLLTSSWDGTTRLWDIATGQELARSSLGIASLQLSPNGRELAGYEGINYAALSLYEIDASRAVRFLCEPNPERVESIQGVDKSSAIWEVNFSPDERFLVSAGKQGVRVWDLPRGVELARLSRNEAFSAFFDPDGEHLVASGKGGLFRWKFVGDGQGTHFSGPESMAEHDFSDRAASSADGKVLAYGNAGRILLAGRHDSFEGWPDRQWVAVSRDGHWVAASAWSHSGIRLWDVAKNTLTRELPTYNQAVLAFSPDNRWLASGSAGEYCFWDVTSGERLWRLARPDTPNFQGMIAFSPDGRLVAIVRSLTQVQLLNTSTFDEVARLDSPVPQLISWLAFSPSGNQLAVATETPFIQIWDLHWVREQLASIGLDWSSEIARSRSGEALSKAGMEPRLPGTKTDQASHLPFVALTGGGVLLAIGLAIFVSRRHQKLVLGYQRLDEVALRRARELETAQQELLYSQKMKALGTLAAGIAHDFNNLLSVINLSNDIIAQESPGNLSIGEEVKSIENAVQQGRTVVRSMLGYSRGQSEQAGDYAVADVVGDTVSLLSKQFLSGIVMTIDVSGTMPTVWGARSRLEQILLNLIVNAAEAMKAQGKLRINTTVTRILKDNTLVLQPRPAEEYAEVSVSDSGPGIPPEILPRIFEPFFTTKVVGSSPGTGLGLSTVYTIAQQDGLGLAVETIVGRGTTFRVLIPVTEENPKSECRNAKEVRNPNAESPVEA